MNRSSYLQFFRFATSCHGQSDLINRW